MRKLVLLFSLMALLASSATASPRKPRLATVKVYVTPAKGSTLYGRKSTYVVILYNGTLNQPKAIADRRGVAVIKDVPAGPWEVLVTIRPSIPDAIGKQTPAKIRVRPGQVKSVRVKVWIAHRYN